MDSLNFQHLRYFWSVAREGSLTRAAKNLDLSPSTLSAQIHALEQQLGCQLLTRSGRELVLTDVGRRIAQHAEQVFQVGRLIQSVAKSGASVQPLHIHIGVGDVIPKAVVHRITQPLFRMGPHVRFTFCEERSSRLLNDLELGRLDMAIADGPLGTGTRSNAYEQHILESEVYLYSSAFLWEKYRKNYPKSLHNAPFYLPTSGTNLRRSLDKWFHEHQITPKIIAEFDDAALLKFFGQDGSAVFPATSLVRKDLELQFNLRTFGVIEGIKESFYLFLSEKAFQNSEIMNTIRDQKENKSREWST